MMKIAMAERSDILTHQIVAISSQYHRITMALPVIHCDDVLPKYLIENNLVIVHVYLDT